MIPQKQNKVQKQQQQKQKSAIKLSIWNTITFDLVNWSQKFCEGL